jgi:hypothetical protein
MKITLNIGRLALLTAVIILFLLFAGGIVDASWLYLALGLAFVGLLLSKVEVKYHNESK